MSKRAICPGGEVPLDPNAHLPDPESEERQRLADEFERGRKAALAAMQQVGHVAPAFQYPSSAGTYCLSAFHYNTFGSNY